MLPAGSRLRRREEFAAALAGRRVRSHGVVLHAGSLALLSAGIGRPGPLVGFIVSKRVGSAVDRNRVRRRLRHEARNLLPQLPTDVALVIRALPESREASAAELGRALSTGVARLDLSDPI